MPQGIADLPDPLFKGKAVRFQCHAVRSFQLLAIRKTRGDR